MVLTITLLQNKYMKYFKFLKNASYIGKKIKTTYTLILVSSIIPTKRNQGSLEKQLILEVRQEEYKGAPGTFW